MNTREVVNIATVGDKFQESEVYMASLGGQLTSTRDLNVGIGYTSGA